MSTLTLIRSHWRLVLFLLLATLLIGLVTAVTSTLLLEAVAGMSVIAYLMINRVVGLCLLMVFFLIQQSPLYQSFGFLAGSVTLSDGLAVIVLGAALVSSVRFQLPTREDLARRAPRLQVLAAVVAFFAWAVITSFWSPASYSVLTNALRTHVEAVVVLALALLILRDRKTAGTAAAVYATTAALLALFTIFSFVTNNGFATNFAGNVSSAAYRGAATGYNANELSVILALGPPFAALATRWRAARYQLPLMAASLLVTVPALVILFSRGTMIGIAVAFLVVLLFGSSLRQKVIVLAICTGIALIIVFLSASGQVPAYAKDRIAQTQYDQAGDRLPRWQQGLAMFAANPLAGTGESGFATVYPTYVFNVEVNSSVHSDYIQVLADYGAIGFLLLCGMVLVIGFMAVGGAARSPASIGIGVILMVASFSGTFLASHWYWVAVALLVCIGVSEREESHEDVPAKIEAVIRPKPGSRLALLPMPADQLPSNGSVASRARLGEQGWRGVHH